MFVIDLYFSSKNEKQKKKKNRIVSMIISTQSEKKEDFCFLMRTVFIDVFREKTANQTDCKSLTHHINTEGC